MRTLPLLSCLIAFALATTGFAQDKTSNIKIGLVDMERIFGEYYKTKIAEDEVEAVKEVIKGEVEQRRLAHEKLYKEAKAIADKMNDPTLSEALRKKHQTAVKEKEAELRSLDQEMKDYSNKRRQQLITQVEESKTKILNEMSVKINEIGKAAGFDVVFDRSGLSERGFPFVVFVAEDNDLTATIIEKLNADAPKTPEKSE